MATTNNLFVLTEQPPLLGKIISARAGAQIRDFLMARRKYVRRHGENNMALPSLAQTMEENDLDQIRIVMTARFVRMDREAYSEEYIQREAEEQESDESEGDESDDDLRRLASIQVEETFTEQRKSGKKKGKLRKQDNKVSNKKNKDRRVRAAEKIRERRDEFEKSIFEENNLVEALRYIYGPKNLVQGVEFLRAIRMDRGLAPYRSLQEAAEYVARFQEALEWVGEYRPASKVIRQIFIKGIQPQELQEELNLREIRNLGMLQDTFTEIYFENHSSLIRLGAAGALKTEERAEHNAYRNRNKIDKPVQAPIEKSAVWSARREATWTPRREGTPETYKETRGNMVTPKKPTEKLCFACNQPGHYANACPARVTNGGTSIKINRSILRSNLVERRAVLACTIGPENGPEPTLQVQANMDSLSDVNLIPKQWLTMLLGEGAEPTTIVEPFKLKWGIGTAEVIISTAVTLKCRVLGWANQGEAAVIEFGVIEGDGDALTIGWSTMRNLGITAELETLVAAQRVLGLTLACPSPQEDPTVRDLDGRVASVSERELVQSERERLIAEASSQGGEWEDDFVDPASVPPNELFIGRKSLEKHREEWLASGVFQKELIKGGQCLASPMVIKLRDGFELSVVKGVRRYAPRVQAALDEEVSRQLQLGVIEECEDPPMQEVVMVRKVDAASGYRFTLDARNVNVGMVVEPCNPPPVAEVLRAIAGCQYLARLDLIAAYWQFPLAEESRYLSAFRVGARSYRYRVVYMGGGGSQSSCAAVNANNLTKAYRSRSATIH